MIVEMGTSYNDLYGKASPERGTFLRLLLYTGGPNFISWGIWKGREIYDFHVYKAQKGQQMHLTAVQKSRERSAFVTYSYITHSALTALKRDAKI